MQQKTIQFLNTLNRDFYAAHAATFARSREYYWDSFKQSLTFLRTQNPTVLDVGCGTGRLGKLIFESYPEALYVGIDNSMELLAIAMDTLPNENTVLTQADIVIEPVGRFLSGLFDLIAMFGVLHHVPSHELRLRRVKEIGIDLNSGGLLAVTFWQPAKHARFDDKLLDPTELDDAVPEELEHGDYFMGWQDDMSQLRYVHSFSDDEVERIKTDMDMPVILDTMVDGKEKYNRLVVWQNG